MACCRGSLRTKAAINRWIASGSVRDKDNLRNLQADGFQAVDHAYYRRHTWQVDAIVKRL